MLKRHKKLIPLIILGLCCIYTALNYVFSSYESGGVTYSHHISAEHFLGFLLITLNFLIYFFRRERFEVAFLCTVVIGIFDRIKFLPFNLNIGFGGVSFGLLPLLMMLVFLWLISKNRFKANDKEVLDTEKISLLKARYSGLSEEKLKEIYQDRRFAAEAKVAAEQLLEKNAQ